MLRTADHVELPLLDAQAETPALEATPDEDSEAPPKPKYYKPKKTKAEEFAIRKRFYSFLKLICLCDNRVTQRIEDWLTKVPFGLDFVLTCAVIGSLWLVGGLLLGLLYVNEKAPTQALTQFQTDVLKHLHVPPTCLSIIGSVSVMLSIFIFKGFKKFNIRLILYLKISDFLLDGSFLLVYVWKGFCVVQAAFSQFCPLSSVLFTSFIAFVLYQSLVKRRRMDDLKKLEIPFLLIGYGLPLISAIIVLAVPGMGSQQLSWCWISTKYASWRFMFFYLILFLIFIYNAAMYVIIMRYAAVSLLRLAKYGDEDRAVIASRKTAVVASRFALFLLAFMITWVWGLSHRIYNLINPNPVYPLLFLHTFFTPFQGFLNMLAYGIIFQAKIISFCKTKICCRKKEEE